MHSGAFMASPEAAHECDSDVPLPCLADMPPPPPEKPILATALRALDDEERERLPASLPPVIDGHVHLFPDRVFTSLWRWFEAHAWPIRYRLNTPAVVRFLLSRGIERMVALHYAHKPGMARMLNAYMAEVVRTHPGVHGVATVFPGEPDAAAILEEGFAAGLCGVKLHCHVQAFAPDAPALHAVYETCVRHDMPLVMHAGREPRSPAYPVDTYALCAAERVQRVLADYPKLRLCVPHLGADELERYAWLLERYDHLWLDTTMMLGDYFPLSVEARFWQVRPERILYGSDFPNLPYAWDREVRQLAQAALPETDRAALLGETARAFFRLPEAP